MSFCPKCGKEVSEDIKFCPECGERLEKRFTPEEKQKYIQELEASVKEEKPAKQTRLTNKKLAGIIAACTIAIIAIVVIATHSPTSIEPEPEIPAHYTTYTDELGLFSISYPPEWELDLESIEDIEQFSQEMISSITSDIPVEEAHFIFMAGLPIAGGYIPNANIVVEPLTATILTHDDMVVAAIQSLKLVVSDYHEFSRVRTTVDNRTATIIDCEATLGGLGTFHYVFMCCIVNKTIWAITCTALPDEYSEWEDDFDAIVRSLRILK